jgi:serine/threonine protein kinase
MLISQLGSGGMGDVYRAHDAKLNRDVAIKVLRGSWTTYEDRLVRFRREAQLLASLNHPNIAQIHGLEEFDGTCALVMELVDGPTLADRIIEGPCCVVEALQIASKIVDALETAHQQGIVHRDLKPSNIKLRDDGIVKVLDFGLAKLVESTSAAANSATISPTISLQTTTAGVILGTAAYMSPEQARGKAVDKRADIWSFGCVLYELLTRRRAFGGDEISDTLAFVITKEPDPATMICETTLPYGASWGADDTIVFSRGGEGLWRVPAAGGTARAVIKPDSKRGELKFFSPQILPGGGAILFTIIHTPLPRWDDDTEVVVQLLASGERKVLVHGGADGRYLPSGHLIYLRKSTLMGMPFDLPHLAATGGAVALIADVMQSANTPNESSEGGAGQFRLSATGVAPLCARRYLFPIQNVRWRGSTGTARRSRWTGDADQDDGCPRSVEANLHGGYASDALPGPVRRDSRHSRLRRLPDGRRFLMVQQKDRLATRLADMIVVENWVEELRQKVGPK